MSGPESVDPNWWVQHHEMVRNYAITIGGLFAAIVGVLALRLNARRTAAIQKQTETQEQTLETQRQTLQTQRDSLRHQQESEQRRRVAETFSRAIDQLGSEQMAVRLGAIYTLSAVANEEVEGSDWRQAVVDTLCAFIRDGGPKAFDEIRRKAEGSKKGMDQDTSTDDLTWPRKLRSPADLEATITEIGKLSKFKPRIDLNGADLRFLGGAVDKIKLKGAQLQNSVLNGAYLSNATLVEARLGRVQMSKAILFLANLRGAYFWGANLSGSDLQGANLFGAELEGANLNKAELSEANLSEADLSEADLSEANLSGCDLSDVKGITTQQIAHANCKGAKLPKGVTWDEETYEEYLRQQYGF